MIGFLLLNLWGCSSETAKENTDTSETTDSGSDVNGLKTADDLGEGNLVISEIQKNPCSLGDADSEGNQPCLVNDDDGEWFEIYNNTSEDIDLIGLVITDTSEEPETIKVTDSLVIQSGMYLVFGNNDDSESNGGVEIDFEYNSNFQLANGDDEIILSNESGFIDIVGYDNGTTFPDDKGYSLTLNPDTLDATSNDDGANWCNATSMYSIDYGTPGAANDPCIPAD